ncbi:MAG TPA: DNA methyltransferase [Burkholderiales bacterium]|nr:DNA methyltransferase [Burkholderiales bacterium]
MSDNSWCDSETKDYTAIVRGILSRGGITQSELAQYLGTSLVLISRWVRGDIRPDPQMQERLADTLDRLNRGQRLDVAKAVANHVFASRGVRRHAAELPLFASAKTIEFDHDVKAPILTRLRQGELWGEGTIALAQMLANHLEAAPTLNEPPSGRISAGKNTYTYDAHTYHTKVPPQGIAAILRQYLPRGGLVLDPFAGSGMTGVAARTLNLDVILNELSPSASFIADRFTRQFDPSLLAAAVNELCKNLADLRHELYTTRCRSCGKNTEILFTVWSYRVKCHACNFEFLLWDHCRRYGKTVREHKILSEFPCPRCTKQLKKSRLQRTTAEPVLLGYKCCSRQQVEYPLTEEDRALLRRIEKEPPLHEGFFPTTKLPDGVNLCQPKRHGLTSIDRFYTPRNLAAMSALWHYIHRVKDDEVAGFLAFVFTSLYQRVTRLSEFRFWGGSGNTANFNVPYLFNEANVFVTFERKARTIQDHLETTAQKYGGQALVRTGSATNLNFLPDNSIDFIFTDPPFGANINYSEMNILWESWFGCFTDKTHEAVINRFQNKDVSRYGQLMTDSLRECSRVLRSGHWMVLVFMNSSREVWQVLRDAILKAGFLIERVDIFDKQHGTFKQFVSENTAGCDLLLHCRKVGAAQRSIPAGELRLTTEAVHLFLNEREGAIPKLPYLHVSREEEIDYRVLYSEFLARQLTRNESLIDFPTFRSVAASILERN